MSFGGESFSPCGAYDSAWDCVLPIKGKFTFNYVQYLDGVECVCMLNDWISCDDDICAVNYNYSRFKLKDKCRSEKWEVFLYGYMTFQVVRAHVQFYAVVVTSWHGVRTCRKLRSSPQLQLSALRGLMGSLFRAVYTGTRPGVSPAIRAGKGWRGRRELAPRCSATQLGA